MTRDRTLIRGPALTVGTLVSTPAGRAARVLHVDPVRHEATVEIFSSRCAFRTSKLMPLTDAEARALGLLVFLPAIGAEPANDAQAPQDDAEGEA